MSDDKKKSNNSAESKEIKKKQSFKDKLMKASSFDGFKKLDQGDFRKFGDFANFKGASKVKFSDESDEESRLRDKNDLIVETEDETHNFGAGYERAKIEEARLAQEKKEEEELTKKILKETVSELYDQAKTPEVAPLDFIDESEEASEECDNEQPEKKSAFSFSSMRQMANKVDIGKLSEQARAAGKSASEASKKAVGSIDVNSMKDKIEAAKQQAVKISEKTHVSSHQEKKIEPGEKGDNGKVQAKSKFGLGSLKEMAQSVDVKNLAGKAGSLKDMATQASTDLLKKKQPKDAEQADHTADMEETDQGAPESVDSVEQKVEAPKKSKFGLGSLKEMAQSVDVKNLAGKAGSLKDMATQASTDLLKKKQPKDAEQADHTTEMEDTDQDAPESVDSVEETVEGPKKSKFGFGGIKGMVRAVDIKGLKGKAASLKGFGKKPKDHDEKEDDS